MNTEAQEFHPAMQIINYVIIFVDILIYCVEISKLMLLLIQVKFWKRDFQVPQ
ncbi:MAG: hypothetical protein ACR5LB_00390 [Wolbachia sp.]